MFPQFAALVDSLRTLDPSLLVFSAGDNRTGNPLNDKYSIPSYPMVALMNAVGFNGSTLGNHDFDNNSLKRVIGLSNFRYICANIHPDDTLNLRTVPCQVFDVEGLKVGVVGAVQLGQHGIPNTHPDNLHGIRFSQPRETIAQYEWLSRQCDVTILLSHLGYDEEVEMAKRFPWLDLIIGGHSHTQLKGDHLVNNVLMTQNKNNFRSVTYITLTVDSGRVVDKKAEYIDVRHFPRKLRLVDAMVQYFSSNPMFQQVVGFAETPFGNTEELGCLLCDALVEYFGADIALENPGGIRVDSHPAGAITKLDVLKIDPFDNNAVLLDLTGEELLRMMLSYSNYQIRRFPFVSGIRCVLTPCKSDSTKIKSVRMLTPDGKKLNMKRRYRVATNSYLPVMSTIPEGSAHIQNIQTTDVLIEYLKSHPKVDYRGRRNLIVKSGRGRA